MPNYRCRLTSVRIGPFEGINGACHAGTFTKPKTARGRVPWFSAMIHFCPALTGLPEGARKL